MKRSALYLVGILLLAATTALAQDTVTTTTTITLQEAIITCPGDGVAQPVLAQADLVLNFGDLDDTLVVPSGSVEVGANSIVIRTTEVRITCTAPDVIANIVQRSPSVGLNETPPRDENLEGLPEIQSGYIVVDTASANLRSCDNPTCTVVGIADGGDRLIALGRNADESWWYVREGELTGWIFADLIVLRGDLSETPFVQTAGEVTPPSLYVGFTGNPIYEGINGTGRVICGIVGDRFNLLVGRNSTDSWYLIEAICEDGRTATGWIDATNGLVRNTGLVPVPILRD